MGLAASSSFLTFRFGLSSLGSDFEDKRESLPSDRFHSLKYTVQPVQLEDNAKRLRLTLAFVQRSVASLHLWQQNGVTWSMTEVPQVRTLARRLGRPNTVTRHTFFAVCVARSSVGLDAQGSMALHAGGHRGPGLGVCTGTLYCPTVRSQGDVSSFRPLLWIAGCGHWANTSFHPGRTWSSGMCDHFGFWPSLAHFHQRDLFGFWPSLEIVGDDSARALRTLVSGPVV